MHLPRVCRLILAGVLAAVPIGVSLAQTAPPAASPTATPSPEASPTPAASPVSSATPVPSPVPVPVASPTPQAASPPTPTPAAPAPTAPPPAAQAPAAPLAQAADPFGEPITLEAKKVVTIKGNANWDSAFETLIEAFKALTALLDKQGVKASGNSMIVYTSTDDTGFTFVAQIPVGQDVKNLAKNMSMGQSPEGKSLKFVHRGSYDNMDNTYEAITNHLDDKRLEAKDLFIEEYITDPLKTSEDKLVINVYVPLK